MADELRFLTQSQCIIIILHDLFIISSFILSYPLYSSYFIFFSPYLIKIVSLLSPLFISAVLLSLLLTTTAFKLPQLELVIFQAIINELKSNLDVERCDFEDFEIYKFVFDDRRSIAFRDEDVDPFEEEKEKVLEDSVHCGRKNDVSISELEMDEFEEESSLVKEKLFLKEKVLEDSIRGRRRNDVMARCSVEEESSLVKLLPRQLEKNFPLKKKVLEDSEHGGRRNDNTNLSIKEKVLEDSVHCSRRNDIPISELETDEFEEESSLVKLMSRRWEEKLSLKKKVLEDSIHGGRRNAIIFEEENSLVTRRPEKNLSMKEKVLEGSVHGGCRNDVPISELEMDEFEEENSLIAWRPEKNLSMKEKVLEDSVHGGRRNDIPTSELDVDEFEEEISLVKLTSRRLEEVLEDSIHGGRRNDIPISELEMDEFEEENSLVNFPSRKPENNRSLPEKSVYSGRRNDLRISEFENVKSQEQTYLMKLFEELDRFEEFSTSIETRSDSGKAIGGLRKGETINFRTGSDVIDSTETDRMIKTAQNVKSSSWRSNSSSIYNRHGSMGEEKEWRRTLACKLFEERHNSLGGEEGMDSLWEAYEVDNSKKNRKDDNNGGFDEEDEDEDDYDEDEEMSNGGLCCLQALKLSTGKMNLGMKKPNLLKISKALRGFGWLHHVKIKHHGNKS